MAQRMLRRSRRAVLAPAAATVLALAGTEVPASAAAPAMTLSSTTGPSGGGDTITATVSTTSATPFPPGDKPVIQFQYFGSGAAATCGTTAKDIAQVAVSGTTTTAGVLTVDPDTVRHFSTTKIAFAVPSSAYPALDGDGNASTINSGGLVLAESQTSAKWNICAYDDASTTTSALLATATYTVVPRPSITSITPASSPASGGHLIAVDGTGFRAVSTPISASIGGAELTDITVASNGNSFTARTGPRTAGTDLALVVETPGGAVSSADPDFNDLPEDDDPGTNDAPILFAYSNGITITPNTAASGTSLDIDVIGAGFEQLTFAGAGTPTDTQAHIFLVKDAYDAGLNRGVAECEVVAVVSDNELFCTLDLAADQLSAADSSVLPSMPITEGAYILTVVATGALDAGADALPTIISSGAVFTVGPY